MPSVCLFAIRDYCSIFVCLLRMKESEACLIIWKVYLYESILASFIKFIPKNEILDLSYAIYSVPELGWNIFLALFGLCSFSQQLFITGNWLYWNADVESCGASLLICFGNIQVHDNVIFLFCPFFTVCWKSGHHIGRPG